MNPSTFKQSHILLQLCHTEDHLLWPLDTLQKIASCFTPSIHVDIRHRKEDFQGNDPVLSRMEISEYAQLWLFAVGEISMEDLQSINAYSDMGGRLILINNAHHKKNPLYYLDASRQWFEDKNYQASLTALNDSSPNPFYKISSQAVICPNGEDWMHYINQCSSTELHDEMTCILNA